jgi:formate dehydrogenase maturation protein FdhE
MEKLISCCGLNCAACDARVATINNDDELRKATAEKWKVAFSADIVSEMINCTGCREEGLKFSHCSMCEIRKCVNAKGYNTCGNCSELETCSIVGGILKAVPDALANLRSLN